MLLSITFLMGCQERGMDKGFSCVFYIKDSIGNNLVGDSITPNRYFVDSIKCSFNLNGQVYDTSRNYISFGKDFYKGYAFFVPINYNTTINYLLVYNSIEKDTCKVIYGKDNINVYQNKQLIFSKYNLSRVPPVEFNIIK